MQDSVRINEQYVRFYFKSGGIISIDRKRMTIMDEDPSFNPQQEIFFEKFIGCYNINTIQFCAVVTKSEPVFEKLGIFKVTETKVIQISQNSTPNKYCDLIQNGLKLCNLYYSDTHDITMTLQQIYNNQTERNLFTWNYEAKSLGERYNLNIHTKNLIAGNIETYKTPKYELLLISRRANKCAGPRYWARGADDEGYVANFVETETVVYKEDKIYSFVQIRGSIPIAWTQYPDLRPQPEVVVGPLGNSQKSLTSHFDKLRKMYGTDIICVCLTENKGRKEGNITKLYMHYGSKEKDVKMVHFPMNTLCKGNKFENVSKVLENIGSDLSKMGYTEISNKRVIKSQNGIVRTNCLDNLDRTNYMQQFIAGHMLGIDSCKEYTNAWTDNGDSISIQYCGTRSLTGEIIKTGKLSLQGKLSNALVSTRRFFINTWKDGAKQDMYDAVTQRVLPQPVKKSSPIIEFIVLLLFAFTLLFRKGFVAFRGAIRNAKGCFVQKPSFRAIKYPDPNEKGEFDYLS